MFDHRFIDHLTQATAILPTDLLSLSSSYCQKFRNGPSGIMKRIKTQCLPTVTTAERSICCHEQPVERAAVMAGLECVDFGEAACPNIPALSPGTGQQTPQNSPEHKFENYFARRSFMESSVHSQYQRRFFWKLKKKIGECRLRGNIYLTKIFTLRNIFLLPAIHIHRGNKQISFVTHSFCYPGLYHLLAISLSLTLVLWYCED